jgi:hypothetical protein
LSLSDFIAADAKLPPVADVFEATDADDEDDNIENSAGNFGIFTLRICGATGRISASCENVSSAI